jgi:hypothetical protein
MRVIYTLGVEYDPDIADVDALRELGWAITPDELQLDSTFSVSVIEKEFVDD